MKGCVYFFRHIGLSPVKIGYSENPSPIDRFNQFKTYAPYGAEILGFIQTDEAKEIESTLHQKYSNKRLEGEWFDITEADANKEIDFWSNKEDIKMRNEFQIAFAKKLVEVKEEKERITLEIPNYTNKYVKFVEIYTRNPNQTKVKIALQVGISRKCVYDYIKRYYHERLKR